MNTQPTDSFQLDEISLDEYTVWFLKHLSSLEGRSPFHQPAWLKTIGKITGHKVVIIGIFDAGTLKAAMPGFLKKFGPIKLYGSPLRGASTPYLGPVGIHLEPFKDCRLALVKMCNSFVRKRWGVLYSEFSLSDLSASDEFGASWERAKWTTYILDLTPGEEILWSRSETRFRRHVRKSQRLGLQIVPLQDPGLYHRMHNETLGRRGVGQWRSENFFKQLIEQLPKEFIWSYGIEYEGNTISAGIFIHDDAQVYYLTGASFSRYRSLPTSYLLHWHVVTSAVRSGMREYDLGTRADPNVELFKKSLGPQLTQHCFLTETALPIRLVKNAFESSRPRLQRLKRWVVRKT